MKKWGLGLCALMLLMLLAASAAAAGKYSPTFVNEPPQEVLEHIAQKWPTYELEDYCEVKGTSKGDYGFALLHRQSERILAGYHRADGRMKYWLKNAGAVPQGKEEAWFNVGEPGWRSDSASNEVYTEYYDDGLWFSVTRIDSTGTFYDADVTYRWQNGMFCLDAYSKACGDGVRVSENKLDFYDWTMSAYAGTVKGTVQRDIRYVSFSALPKWMDDAKEKLTAAPNLKSGDFVAQKIKFTGGQKYPVYTGPGEEYARSGSGKGLVSTNGWIEVYGQKDGWILIQYSISSTHYRFGWIDQEALPKGTTVPELNLRVKPGDQSVVFDRNSYLTDDPLVSGEKLCTLKAEQTLFYLGSLNDEWAYVMVQTEDGKWMCGFMPHQDISNG